MLTQMIIVILLMNIEQCHHDIKGEEIENEHENEIETIEDGNPDIDTEVAFGNNPNIDCTGSLDDTLPILTPYGNYCQVMNISDEDNEESDQNIMDHEQVIIPTIQSQRSLQELLSEFIQSVQVDDVSTVIIRRSKILRTTLKAISKNGFNIRGKLFVEFSGEDAHDDGGPRREFLRLLMQEVGASMGIFEGDQLTRVFSHNVRLISDMMYFKGGQLVAMSLLNGGPGLQCMADSVYNYMIGIEPGNLTIDLIPDSDMRVRVQELQKCSTSIELNKFIEQNGDWIADNGYPDIFTSDIKDVEEICHFLLLQLILFRSKAEMDQFFCGLNDVGGLGQIIKENPDQFRDLFIDRGKTTLPKGHKEPVPN
ncbi:G2/M phase-specific E3 ubiquitin-protein ligase-like [Saccoglossus kowalevskii]